MIVRMQKFPVLTGYYYMDRYKGKANTSLHASHSWMCMTHIRFPLRSDFHRSPRPRLHLRALQTLHRTIGLPQPSAGDKRLTTPERCVHAYSERPVGIRPMDSGVGLVGVGREHDGLGAQRWAIPVFGMTEGLRKVYQLSLGVPWGTRYVGTSTVGPGWILASSYLQRMPRGIDVFTYQH